MGRGRRYDGEQKLNFKKVIAAILFIAVVVMIIVLMINFPKKSGSGDTKNVSNSYIAVYTNGKWGVINSKGDIVVQPTYDEYIVIPDATKPVFICETNVDADNVTYSSNAIDNSSKQLFTSYDKVEALQNVDSDGQVFYANNVLKVSKDGKFGLINLAGKELLPCNYDSIEPIKYIANSFVTKKDGKFGLVDNGGSVIIENLYSDITALTDKYEDGYIVKDDNGKFGLINYSKKQVLDCKYSDIQHVAGSDMYVVKENGNTELITSDGTVKLSNKFDKVASIDNSNVIYISGGKYFVMTSDGEDKLTDYQYLEYISDGNYIAKKDNSYGVININGNTTVAMTYKNFTYMKDEGFFEATREDGNVDILNSNYEVKVTGMISEINSKLGYIKVRVNSDYKYYNLKLEEKKTSDILASNTLFLSKQNGKYGFVNKNGIVVVDYIYDDATEQNDFGYSAVKKDGKWGAIDQSGKVVVEPSLALNQNTVISFIGKWHMAVDLNANYYTDVNE